MVTAARKALDTHGYGLSSVRFICGTQDLHTQLEAKISAFHGTEDTILYPSCFDANAGNSRFHDGRACCLLLHACWHNAVIAGHVRIWRNCYLAVLGSLLGPPAATL